VHRVRLLTGAAGRVVYRGGVDVVTVVNLALAGVTIVIKGYALGDAAIRPSAAFDAVGKLPKVFWLIVLFLSFGSQLAVWLTAGAAASWLGLFGILGIIASLVYLFGIRPEVLRYGGRKSRGSSSDGPYGPW
jgi:Protein of unknown function (DUF2516)